LTRVFAASDRVQRTNTRASAFLAELARNDAQILRIASRNDVPWRSCLRRKRRL